jgi:catechol 2,3-dioxygenase-like lactoylglutathione lyase family enzyme
MPLTKPGPLHRLGLAVEDADATTDWFVRVLGATPFATRASATETDGDPDGGHMQMLTFAGQPFLLMSPSTADGFVAGFLKRYGPAVHSLAWEIDDLWAMEHLLELRGVRIAGVSIEGRHFFMHPKSTFGLLMEWTDDKIPGLGTGMAGVGEIGVPVTDVGWIAGVVDDVDAAFKLFQEFGGATAIEGLPAGPAELERTFDLQMGPTVVRLVTPISEKSRYSLDRGPRWWSVGLRVPDLDATLVGLERAGVTVLGRDGAVAWTDPATTAGLPFEWTN